MKFILTLLLSLIFQSTIEAQNYESIFGSESTQWNITIGNLWGVGTAVHKIIGDTVIDNRRYKIVNGYVGDEGIKGFLRQDSTHSMAWYRSSLNSNEVLLMDLNLNIGDSLYVGGNWNSNHGFYKVDSVYIVNNRKHIRFDFDVHFFSNEKFTLIEGVVSNLGFRYQDNDYINAFPTILLCSYKNNLQNHGNAECIISSIKDIIRTDQISVFPNPFTHEIYVKTDNLYENLNFTIFDLFGKQLIRKNIFSNEQRVGLEQLKNGYYNLIISNKDGAFLKSIKIIKVSNNR